MIYKVTETAMGPLYQAVEGELLTNEKSSEKEGVRFMSPLYLHDLRKMGCLEVIERTKPKKKPAKRPLRVREKQAKDSKDK